MGKELILNELEESGKLNSSIRLTITDNSPHPSPNRSLSPNNAKALKQA